jgi:hypothetical protein
MCQKDQNKIICNAIHSIRLLQLANSNNTNNYFDSDNQTYEAVCGCFPVFANIELLKTMKEFIKSFKLDAKELALYAALLSFSSSGHQLSSIQNLYGLNLDICRALTAYMKMRRNESESAELLIYYGVHFEKINICLQRGIYERFKEIEFCFMPKTFIHNIIYSSFEVNNN